MHFFNSLFACFAIYSVAISARIFQFSAKMLSLTAKIIFWPFFLAKFLVNYVMEYLPYFKYQHVPNLDGVMGEFESKYNKTHGSEGDIRRQQYGNITATFYNLITDFYEYGWGHSFHFAPRYQAEPFHDSIKRYEHHVARLLNVPATVPSNYKVLDAGCGIGGPLRAVSRFLNEKATIVGVNITAEHIRRCRRYNERIGLKNFELIQADFNDIPVPDNYFDAGYDFEATLHSTDLERTFKEFYRVLKPGARMVTAQYCLLDNYDDTNEYHRDIIRRVDNTNGCYCAGRYYQQTHKTLESTGFKVLDRSFVFEENGDVPFHQVFENTAGQRFAGTKLGLFCTYAFCAVGETLGLMPKGTTQVQQMLIGAAESFKEAGREKILTPGVLFVLEKPLQQS